VIPEIATGTLFLAAFSVTAEYALIAMTMLKYPTSKLTSTAAARAQNALTARSALTTVTVCLVIAMLP
jgi:hypothetical protein